MKYMPKKVVKKPTRKQSLTERTLLWLSVFFILVSIFVILMYYRQAQDVNDFLKLEKSQRDAAAKLVSPESSPKPLKK